MATSYTIDSPHYEGAPSVRSNHKISIPPEKIKSMESLSIGPHLINGKVVMKTANNIYTDTPEGYLKNGYFSQLDDFQIDGMKEAGERNPPNKHGPIPRTPDIAYITDITPSRMNFLKGDTPVHLYTTDVPVNAIHPNNEGRYVSKVGNLEQLLRDLIGNDKDRYAEAAAWIAYLAKKGYSIESSKNAEITALGIEKDVQKEGYEAFYYPRKGILGVEEDFHNKVKNSMSRYGVTDREAIEIAKSADLLHELSHRLGVKSELLQGLYRTEFYSKLAEIYKGTKKERIYRALAEEGIDYAREYSPWKRFLDKIKAEPFPKKEKSQIELLLDKYSKEADELGLTGDRKETYKHNRLLGDYGELLMEEPSYYGESENKKSGKENLEERVNKLKEEARKKGLDETEYASAHSIRGITQYIKDKGVGAKAEKSEGSKYEKIEKTYEKAHEGGIDKSKYNSMSDAKRVVEEASEATPEAKMDGVESANAEPAESSETADG